MVAALYMEINVICIIILSIILLKMCYMGSALGNKNLFAYTVGNAIFFFVLDFLWAMLDGTQYPLAHECNIVINALYLFQAGHLGYSWYLFSNSMLNSSNRKRNIKNIVALIPLLILFILCFSSIWTGWMFYIDEHNVYHRAELYFVQVLTSYIYMIYAAIKAFIYGLRENNYIKKIEFMTLASFIILPLICGTLQVVYMGIPLLNAGISLSFLVVFITFQDHQISIDPLTESNNRYQLTRHLTSRIGSQNRRQRLFLMMIDIDYFKKINDTYGHVEGDDALKTVADV